MHKGWVALLAAMICGSAGCTETVPAEWPEECVGRLQLALPGEADQAAILGNERFRNSVQYGQPVMRFPDGERTGRTEFSTQFSTIRITHPLSATEKNQATKQVLLDDDEQFIKGIEIGDNVVWFMAINYPNQQYGLPRRQIVSNFLLSNDVYFSWRRGTDDEVEFIKGKADLQSIITNLRPRVLFDVPHQPGLCLPYVFIQDSGQEEHSVAMTYRLKEHPDITVNLRGKTAASTPEKGDRRRPEVVTNEYQTDTYWDGRLGAGAGLSTLRTHWRFPSMRSIKLAGRSGLESFVAVVRSKETEEDHIYHAVARGDPDNPEAAPDVRLVVEQKRQNAIKRGIKPLTQDEVLKLARQIAASVAARPVR